MRIRQAKLSFNSQWENSFLRNVNLIRDSRVMLDKVKEKCLKEANKLIKPWRLAFWEPSLCMESVILWRFVLDPSLEFPHPRGAFLQTTFPNLPGWHCENGLHSPLALSGLWWWVQWTECGPIPKCIGSYLNRQDFRMWMDLEIGSFKRFCCFPSVPQSCLTLCDPIDWSTPCVPVLPYLLEFAQTHVHYVDHAIQPSHPLSRLMPSVFASIRVSSNESAFHIRWPKYWRFSFSLSPSNEYPELISFRIDWFDVLAVQGALRVFSSTTVQKHLFFGALPSLWSNSHIRTQLLIKT